MLVSSARQVRALRLSTLRLAREGAENPEAEENRGSVRLAEAAGDRGRETRRRPPTPPSARQVVEEAEAEESSYEYSEASSPRVVENKKRGASRGPEGVTAKSRAEVPSKYRDNREAEPREEKIEPRLENVFPKDVLDRRTTRRTTGSSPKGSTEAFETTPRRDERNRRRHAHRQRRRDRGGSRDESPKRPEDEPSQKGREKRQAHQGEEVQADRLPKHHFTLVDERKTKVPNEKKAKPWRSTR